jgi:hypothetical protein
MTFIKFSITYATDGNFQEWFISARILNLIQTFDELNTRLNKYVSYCKSKYETPDSDNCHY